MLYKVPINNGVLDIDYIKMIEGRTLSENEAVVYMKDTEPGESWIAIDELEYLKAYGAGKVSAEGNVLTIESKAEEVKVYDANTEELIATVQIVDSVGQCEVTPPISIRVGEKTELRLNEILVML